MIAKAAGFLIDLVPGPLRIWAAAAAIAAALAALGGLYAWRVHVEREVGRDEIRADWNADKLAKADVDLKASQANARETLRRLELQKRNQDAQDQQLAAERADAARDRAERDQLRHQNLATAQRWRDALDNSPTIEQCQAAGAAIAVQSDVSSRLDEAAGILAEYAGAARAAGLKCERDYDALSPVSSPPRGSSP